MERSAVRRTACVDLPAFPLQLLLRRHPDWRGRPAAVVAEDRPQAAVLWADERARALGVRTGMRHAAALTLAPDLRAAAVPVAEVERETRALARALDRFSPRVESSDPADDPGALWLDATGLERLHGTLSRWADGVRRFVRERGFRCAVVVGFSRFGTRVLARSRQGVLVVSSPDRERAAARDVSLDVLPWRPADREALAKLGVATVGDFTDLPASGVCERFGPAVHRLHRLASGELCPPLQSDRPSEPVWKRTPLDPPETSACRLLAAIDLALAPLLADIADRGEALSELRLGFRFERTGDHVERLRPAAPTLDAGRMMELIRLRLEAVRRFPDGVLEIVLIGHGVPAEPEQLRLFGRPRRDLGAANRALARVRASLGDGVVVRAALRPGHLPEARFAWEPLDSLALPTPAAADAPRLVRRIHDRPLPLPPRARHEPDGWMLRDLKEGPVVRVLGPYVVSGGWWNGRGVHREYHFAETATGDVLWVFYDRARRRWFLQGRVE
jgi:protein ImuB